MARDVVCVDANELALARHKAISLQNYLHVTKIIAVIPAIDEICERLLTMVVEPEHDAPININLKKTEQVIKNYDADRTENKQAMDAYL